LLGDGRADLHIVGSATADLGDDSWRRLVGDALAKGEVEQERAQAIAADARYLQADVTDEADFRRLMDACRGRLIVYFALPPAITMSACQLLAELGVPEGTRLVMEKPFGTDAASAEQLNELLTRLVPEEQIFRVDHFLGMSTVLDIIGLRFANRILEPLWSAQHVRRVDIVFDERIALEGRAGYYDGTGALVDMIQSHALQVLSLLAMEPPPTLSARDLREYKTQALRATHVWQDDPAAHTRRARYVAGEIDGHSYPSYADEDGVDPERQTETLAEVMLAVDTWRWSGVPFRLRSGKALQRHHWEAAVTFRDPSRIPDGLSGARRPDRLRIGFEPDRLSLDININGPGDPSVIDEATLETDFAAGELPPYGQVLAGVLDGDPTLSVGGAAVVECWRILEPVREAWRNNNVPLEDYPAGSAGPERWPAAG
jgi:glucose-6-phosphate 1-dehydrogenase